MVAAQKKSTLEQVAKVVYLVRDQILKHTRGLCFDLSVIADQLDPFQVVHKEDVEGGQGASQSGDVV